MPFKVRDGMVLSDLKQGKDDFAVHRGRRRGILVEGTLIRVRRGLALQYRAEVGNGGRGDTTELVSVYPLDVDQSTRVISTDLDLSQSDATRPWEHVPIIGPLLRSQAHVATQKRLHFEVRVSRF